VRLNGHYILPGELAALLAFLLAPALLLALLAQAVYLKSGKRTAYAFALTCAVSFVALFALLPIRLPAWLGVHDVVILSSTWPAMPLAFLLVAVVAWIIAIVVKRRAVVDK
jgi:hypothetical protein